jgi:type II secretory pathway pseudopilin PulG
MKRITIVAALAATGIAALVAVQVAGATGSRSTAPDPPASCQLGNGVQHVINIVFDNVHFSRDNPNVPSDLEQMPHLLDFLKQYGTVFSNSHTPLIAHTADDSLSIYTGLYGDRHGQPLTNSYKTYNPDGSTDPATSFTYWTSPIIDTKTNPPVANTVDTTPSMAYAGGGVTPAPWVPFTRAGCTVGDFSTANMVLENAAVDVPTVFGANSPEAMETAQNPDPFKDVQVAKYVGEAVHCAQGAELCANSSRAVDDLLPTEPGGYDGYQALFGAQYIAPAVGGGANVFHNGYRVTDANGNLVDLDGNTLQEPFTHTPGFPGFSPTATQSLAVLADMQEAGIPVTYGYISDLHERKADTRTGCTSATPQIVGRPLGPGDSCYVTNAQHYDAAFNTFFQRLQADGITPDNTLFVISAEENDQFAGANVGRATVPTPAGCDGVTVPCNYAAGQIGELQANIKGLLGGTASAGTQFDIEPQGASIYVHGNPAASDPTVRQLERDTAAMTNPTNPPDAYSGIANESIVDYQAGALEQRVLHMQTIDPLRTPTYTLFPKPDYFFSTSGPNVSINNNFSYDHGYYSPNIDVTWVGIAGKGVAVNQVDGPQPEDGNQPSDPESTHTVPEASQVGTWVEETDIRPTMLYLLGLKDDYESDGHVITQALDSVPPALQATEDLAKGYDQIESSVGQFGTDTLIADTRALASGSSSDDSAYETEQGTLGQLADDRDTAVAKIKKLLSNAAAGITPNHGQVTSGLALVRELLRRADRLAAP